MHNGHFPRARTSLEKIHQYLSSARPEYYTLATSCVQRMVHHGNLLRVLVEDKLELQVFIVYSTSTVDCIIVDEALSCEFVCSIFEDVFLKDM